MSNRYVDLSHPIESGMITYKGLPGPIISEHLSRADSRKNYSGGTEFFIGKIEMVANTGTYVDSPFHRYADGSDLSQIPLSSLADLRGIVVRADQRKGRAVDQNFFQNLDLSQKAVLIHTGWDKHWRTDQYSEAHPYLTRQAAEYLVQSRVSLVGIDSFNIDDTADGERSAHTLLLGAGIPIVEHLCNLQALPIQGFRFFAVPPMVQAFGSFPVRAFAILM
jgi:kynurenine formamidase